MKSSTNILIKEKVTPKTRPKNNSNSWRVRGIYALILFLLPPALLINLGIIAFIDDEGIRSLVALEMKLSGNYITPTLLGQFYYNKPPLYNWILLAFFELTGVINEWSARIPTVVFLLAYASTIFYFYKKHFDTKFAFIMAFIIITCGRIFFYDSMLGLIDICYSWIIFSMMMVIYHRYRKKQFTRLFVFAYLLGAIAFLLKGLPTFVFLGLTLLALFVWKKEYSKLWSLDHFKGMFVFLVIVGGYYAVYLQFNSLEDLFPKMVKQSTRRTFVEYSWIPTIKNLFTFHFEQVYHFLPWSALVIYIFQKDALSKILKNDFLTFCVLAFAVNIPLYWSSVEVYPRYLLMFPPLIYGPLLFLHFENKSWNRTAFNWLMAIAMILTLGLIAYIPFFEKTPVVDFIYIKWVFLFGLMGTATFFFFKWKSERLLLFIVFLLGIRLAFNWFVLPERLISDKGSEMRSLSIQLGEMTKDKDLSTVRGVEVEKANAFYITNARQKIISSKGKEATFQKNVSYIIDPQHLPDSLEFHQEFKFICRHNEPYYRLVGQFK